MLDLANSKRLLRTVSHLSPGQVAWRAVHVARTKLYNKLPPSAVPWLRADDTARFALEHPLRLETCLPERGHPIAALWRDGFVKYHGIVGAKDDWNAAAKSRLWQYERHYHTEALALAQVEDAPAVRALVNDWTANCPPLLGPSWEPYPLARRILNWSVALAAEPALASTLAPSLAPQVKHLWWHLEKHLMGNHLLCDLFALIAGSSVLSGMEALHAKAAQLLRHHLREQLLEDGGYAERTAQYHAIVLRDLLWCLALSSARGFDLGLQNEALHMLGWIRKAHRSDGSFPWINDAASDATPNATSLEILARQVGIAGEAPARPSVVQLPQTGWYIHRKGSHELLFDYGVVGPRDQPGHGHCDALHFELIWNGTPVISDTGITTYAVGPVRSAERSAAAHATVSVNNEGSDEVWHSFRVGGRGMPQLLNATSDVDGSVLMATCLSFRGWVHNRSIRSSAGVSLRVEDHVERLPEVANVQSHVPLAPGWRFEAGHLRHGDRCLKFESSCEPTVSEGWQSLGFGQSIPRQVLAIEVVHGRAWYQISEAAEGGSSHPFSADKQRNEP